MLDTPDSDERRRALNPEQSFIVQAPAGSGKTELLIQRYLALLACADEPEEIVAITFTRKAAAEMRERVVAALTKNRHSPDSLKTPETGHDKLTLELVEAVLRRDTQVGWHVAGNPARLRIQTFDSLCASLTRQMPTLSKFGAQPESIEDASDLYLEAAHTTIDLVEGDDAVAQDVQRLLEHLDNDVARVERLLAEMLSRRDHWLRHVHGKGRDELESALRNARHEALERVCSLCDLYPMSMQSELIQLVRYAIGNLIAGDRVSSVFAYDRLDKLGALPGDEEQDVAIWHAITKLLLTKDGEWRKQHTVSNGFPPGGTKIEKEIAKSWKERALALVDQMAANADDTLRHALHNIRLLPPPAYTEQQWEVLGSIMRLLPRAVGQLKLVFQSHNKVDFTEVAQGALRALGEPELPTDLALALDYRIHHLLIDEFQDTSISQYELIAKLTAGWERGDARSVFIVGDPMQSIYRFREAEVGLFLRARAAGIGNVVLEPISLCANFRSQRGIVDWINATFACVMPKYENIINGAVPYTESVATHEILFGPAVSIHPFFNNDHATEAMKVVEIIMQARRDDPASTTAILVRSRNHLHEIIPRLKEAGVRFRAIEIEGLGHRPVVQDLLALTRALGHPGDRLAWLALLRAPWCGLTLADIHAVISTHVDRSSEDIEKTSVIDQEVKDARGNGRTVWELMNDNARMARLSPDGRTRLLRVREVLKHCMDNRCRQSLRTVVEAAWLGMGGPGCIEHATDLGDATVYLDYLEAHEEAGGIPKLAALEEGLAKLYALPDLEADTTLQIMTIHKAKGLEFDCVILPGLGRSSRSNDKKLFMWMEHPRAIFSEDGGNEGNDLLLAPIQETGADPDRIYSWLEKLDDEKGQFEDERLLYVASTRAKASLHLLGSTGLVCGSDGVFELKSPPGKALLSKLWPVVKPAYAAVAAQAMSPAITFVTDGEENRRQAKYSVNQLLRRLVSGWELPAPPPPVRWSGLQHITPTQDDIEYSWVGETARRIGSVVHRWLQRIAEDEVKNWSMARIQLLRDTFKYQLVACGMDYNDGDADVAVGRVVTALTHAVSDTRGQWLLGPQQNVRNELRMTAIIDGKHVNLIIDRTFCDAEGQRWVVDYKTSSHEGTDLDGFLDREQERYRFQLDRYAVVMRLLDGRPVRRGLYFPLLQGWREWGDE